MLQIPKENDCYSNLLYNKKNFVCDYSNHPISEKITQSNGILSLSKCHRLKNGALFNFGKDVEACIKNHLEGPKQILKCKTLNCIRHIF